MRSATFALLLLAFSSAPADTIPLKKLVPLGDLSGIWEAHGVTHDEMDGPTPYTAVVTIKKKDDGYFCQWSAGPGSNILALAHRDGNTFTVAWVGRGLPGMSVFRIDASGKAMDGKWMALPTPKWEGESLKYLAPLPKVKKIDGV